MLTRKQLSVSGVCLIAATVLSVALAEEKQNPEAQAADETKITVSRKISVQVLKPLGTIVGEWKGVGQPKRGSSVGAWTEKAQAVWKFKEEAATLVATFEPGKQFQSAVFSAGADGVTTKLDLTSSAGDVIPLIRPDAKSSETSDGTWIFESASDRSPQHRCTIRFISDIRMTILFEEKPTEKSAYRRVSEIGLTRAGARLAEGNTGERQCIVTGGLGSMKVSFEGKTYYVCCEGCKQAFDADPAGTIDAYRERLKNKAR
jgi:YHS domain-containing protein